LKTAYSINIVSIFPEFFEGPLGVSLLGKARERGLISIEIHNPKDFVERGERVDDYPFGGGPGMVLRAEPVIAAVESISPDRRGKVVAMSASGRLFSQKDAEDLACGGGLTIICGRYEGVDQRAFEILGAVEYSIGDFVLAGGEAAALVVLESTTRLLPGVMGNIESAASESHADGLLEYPQFTRPRVVRGLEVPEVLLSGNHSAVADWRRRQSLLKTAAHRMDLLLDAVRRGLIGEDELQWLKSQGIEVAYDTFQSAITDKSRNSNGEG
jgi:tRNA (guanine37-N1)-methyltransferase